MPYLLQSSVHGPNANQIWHSRAQERTAWAHLRPGVDFMGFNIQLIFELFPLPHGTQRQAVCQLLKDWEWQAKRLQPGKGNFGHMAWRVGPQVPPPHHVMKGFQVDIAITQIKELKQQHLRAAPLTLGLTSPKTLGPQDQTKPATHQGGEAVD